MTKKINIPFDGPLSEQLRRRQRDKAGNTISDPEWEQLFADNIGLLIEHYDLADCSGEEFWSLLAIRLMADFVPGFREERRGRSGVPSADTRQARAALLISFETKKSSLSESAKLKHVAKSLEPGSLLEKKYSGKTKEHLRNELNYALEERDRRREISRSFDRLIGPGRDPESFRAAAQEVPKEKRVFSRALKKLPRK